MRANRRASEEQTVSAESQRAALVDSILKEAEGNAKQILLEAENAVETRADAARQQADRILRDAEQTAAEKIQAIERHAVSRLEVDTRRQQLRVRDEMATRTLGRARQRIADLIGKPEYREVLLGWVVEAGIGLGESVALVNATAREMEMIDNRFLADASQEIKRLTGRQIRLERSGEQPLLSQGVTLTAQDGHVAYSNQVETRIVRLQTQIRRLIQTRLSEEP